MKVIGAMVTVPAVEPAGPSGSPQPASGWVDAFDRAVGSISRPVAAGPDVRLKQLSEMIRLQMEVCRHQVQVELVSKVAESGVASVRKLQQPQ